MTNSDSPELTLKYQLEQDKAKRHQRRHLEFVLWSASAALLAVPMIFNDFIGDKPPFESTNAVWTLVGFLTFFPVLFSLIFEKLPLEALHKLVNGRNQNENRGSTVAINNGRVIHLDSSEDEKKSPEDYLFDLTIASKKLAKSIFSRAGVFLLVGGMIALAGIIFFYINTATLDEVVNNNNMIASMAKHFGILFFIEFVAFFFLKQYRAAMDEFRYYESLQRYREETLALLKFKSSELKSAAAGNPVESDIFGVLEKFGFRTTSEKLENGQTTDLLETKKLSKDETEIFNKILEIISKK